MKTREEQIEEYIKFHAHKFSVRYGYTTTEDLMRGMAKWCDNNQKSPWISVKDRLPDKWKRVKLQSGTGEDCWSWISETVFVNADGWLDGPEKAFYDFEAKIWWSEFGDNIENIFGTPTHWMPIPQIEKNDK